MSFGQNTVIPGNYPFPENIAEQFYFDNSHFVNNSTRAVGDKDYGWFNVAEVLNDLNATTYRLSGWVMAPDTLLNVRNLEVQSGKYVFVYNNIKTCLAGSTFDPYSIVLQLPNVLANTTYVVDSVAIPYIYRRYTADEVVDTLIVQLNKPNHLVRGNFALLNGDKRAFAVPKYIRSTNKVAMPDYEVKIPLTIADTSLENRFRNALIYLPNWTMHVGGPFSLTYSFKPGRTYNLGDTIPLAKWDSVQGVYRPINLFKAAVYSDSVRNSLSPETNHGLFITNLCRYKDWDTSVPAYANTVYPGNGWDLPLYPIVIYKAKFYFVGINHLGEDVKVMLFPIPATTTQDMKLNVTLDGRKNLNIEVYDLLGHKISSVAKGTYNSGTHTFLVSTANLAVGMYICNIVANDVTKTIKFGVK